MKMNMRLMAKGQIGKITEIKADGELGRRLRDMGLVPGMEIKMQGRAPLKDPVAIRLAGYTLTLRNNEADYIELEVD